MTPQYHVSQSTYHRCPKQVMKLSQHWALAYTEQEAPEGCRARPSGHGNIRFHIGQGVTTKPLSYYIRLSLLPHFPLFTAVQPVTSSGEQSASLLPWPAIMAQYLNSLLLLASMTLVQQFENLPNAADWEKWIAQKKKKDQPYQVGNVKNDHALVFMERKKRLNNDHMITIKMIM